MAQVSLVTDQYLSKTDALAVLEKELGVSADRSDPANPVFHFVGGATLTIDVPKFGEDLPLTLDIQHDQPHLATLQAEAVKAVLVEGVKWQLEMVRQVVP